MIPIDLHTLFFNYMLTNIVCMIVMIILWRQSNKRFEGIIYMLIDFCFQVLCTLFIFLRGHIADFISIDVSNTLAVSGAVFGLIGLEYFTGKKSNQLFNYLLIAAFFSIHTYFTFIKPDLEIRNLNTSVVFLIICTQCAWLMLKRVPVKMRRYTFNVGVVFLLFSVVNIIRIIDFFVKKNTSTDYFKAGDFESYVIISYQVLFIFLTFTLALMINKRLMIDIVAHEEKFSKAFHSVPYAIIITRLSDGKLLEVNKGFEDITSFQTVDVIGKTTLELNLWGSNKNRDFFLNTISSRGKLKEIEFQFRKKTGEEFTGLLSSEVIYINDEKCLLSVINDISERKQSEELLRESEQRYHQIFTNSIDAFLLTEAEGTILSVNPATCKMFGRTEEEIYKLGRNAIIDMSDSKMQSAMEERANTGKFYGELTGLRNDGSKFPIEITSSIFMDNTGEKISSIIIRDIEERKQAEKTVKLEEARLESLLKINQHPAENIQKFLDFALEEAITLTESKIGYIYFYNEDKKEFTLNTWSKEVMQQCSVNEPKTIYELDKTGIWGEAVRQRHPILINNFSAPDPLKKGVPEGHAPLNKFLTIPVFNEGQIVAVVGVANKSNDYNDSDIRQLNLMMDSVWKMVQRKQFEDKLQKANRLYAVISQVNQAIVHNLNLEQLFTEICHVAIDFGKFRMAWIGMVDETTQLVKPIAIAGYEEGYLSQIKKITTANNPEGQGPTGTAIREGNNFICNDISTDPRMSIWKEEALKRNYHSSISLPLKLHGKPIGALNIYSDQPNYFNEEEIKLLDEIAYDISYAIHAIETEKEHREAQLTLLESENKFRNLVNQMQYGLAVHEIILDENRNPIDYRFLDINPSYTKITGISREKALGNTVLEILPETEKIWIEKYGQVALTGEPVSFESYSSELDMHFNVVAYQPQKLQFAVIVENISNRKEMENSLKESEEKFRLLAKSAPIGIAITDENQNVIFISDKFVEIFGYTINDVPNIDAWWTIAYPDLEYRKRAQYQWNKTINKAISSNNEITPMEAIIQCKDGTSKNIEFRMTPSGNLMYFIFTDITWRKRAEEAIKQNELKFRTIFNSTSEAIFIYEPIQGRILDNNLAAEEMYGFTKEDFITITMDDISLFDEEYTKEYLSDLILTVLEYNKISFEWKGKRKDNTIFWIDVSLSKATIEGLECIIAVVRNIDERKKLVETIFESEERHRLMFETSQEAIVIIQDSRLVYFNPKLIELTGFSVEEAANMEFTQFIHPDDREKVKINYQRRITGSSAELRYQFRVLRKNNAIRWVNISGSVLQWNGKPAGFYFLSDISELKLAEHQANERLKELNAFYKLAELTERKELSIENFYQEFTNSLPSSWQYSEVTFARIVIDNREFKTDNYVNDCIWKQEAQIIINESIAGSVEIGYLEEMPASYEGPFLKEERMLIDAIADRLSRITERKQAEEKLRISEEKYRLITENASDVIWILNLEHSKFTYISPTIVQLRGLTVEEAMEETMDQSMTFESVERINKELKENLSKFIANPNQSNFYIIEIQQPCKDGSTIWVEISAKIRYNVQGEIEIIGVSRNIEERKKLEAEIKNNEQKFRLLFENSPLGIYIADINGNIIDGNTALLKILGSPSLEYTKQINVLEYPPLIENGYAELFLNSLKNNQTSITELLYTTKWGKQVYLSSYLVPVADSSGKVETIYTLMEDITARKQIEEQLLKNESLLRESNATKDKFFSIISHDLRSPFATLVGFTELMADEQSKFSIEEYVQYSRALNKTAQSAYALLENLLEWSRLQRGVIPYKPKKINIKDFLSDFYDSVIDVAKKKKINLDLIETEGLSVIADQDMLNSIVRNLVLNSVKFTKEGGTISIEVKKDNSGNTLFSVHDNGIGIDAERIKQLFRLDTKVSRPGTNGEPSSGLGLILCKEFIERHGGVIWVESEVGKGSTFSFTIPANPGNKDQIVQSI
jgi:PAS domain S-box-containing protein